MYIKQTFEKTKWYMWVYKKNHKQTPEQVNVTIITARE